MLTQTAGSGKEYSSTPRHDSGPHRTFRLYFLTAFALFLFAIPEDLEADDSSSKREPIAKSTAVLLSDADWKLGSFPFEEGERQGAYLPKFNDSGFRKVKVPGEVQLQIGLDGMDLYYQSKELTLVNDKEWWYRKQFSVPKGSEGKLMRLVFDGVDYFASVWLNGEKLGEHEGAYVPFEFDVTSKLNFTGENQLTVKVTCPWLPKGRGFLEYLKGAFIKVAPRRVVNFSFPPYVLGPSLDFLPAGGNAVFPMGLFRDVKLVASGSAIVEDLFVSTKSLNRDGSATLAVSGRVRNYGQTSVSATINIRLAPDNFAGEPLTLPKRSLAIGPDENAFAEEVTIKNPRLWWTWDTGDQNLYKATATISSATNEAADSRETVFGIRTIVRKEDMSYWLNGTRLFLKGAWYPTADIFGSRPTRETYEKDLLLYRAANLNHIVGFAQVEKVDFYDLCDRLGILNFFEFPFNQFGPLAVMDRANPRRETYIKQALSQVRQIVLLLRKHPSIGVWAPFAEARAIGADYQRYGYPEFADAIGNIVRQLAPGTIYHPSYCDEGEQHFWIGNAGLWRPTSYNEHFHANAKFVSEYGTFALPVLETLKKMLAPEEMWSEKNTALPQWNNLPIDVAAYSYHTSFDYLGLASLFDRVHQFVDRDIKSVKELVEGSQLYQAFLFKYATEAYRRKKYDSINGMRIFGYGEVYPGITLNFLDYYRVPKMSYYYLKNAQDRFSVNFAYEEALESQVSGKRLQIPVWVINDHPRNVPVDLLCEIAGVSGQKIWSKEYHGEIGSDASKEIGVVDWVTTENPGIYVLRAQVTEKGGGSLRADSRTFIKVTPSLFSRPIRMLLIGQKTYSRPIAWMAEGMGIKVDVIDEESIHQLAKLRNPEEIRKSYDLVWLASFDSLWKLLDAGTAEGLKQAIHQGVGFIHSGGPGSFHGGSIRAALLELTPLAEAFPVKLRNRDDLVLAQPAAPAFGTVQSHPPIRGVRLAAGGASAEWEITELNEYGLPGFNRVELKPGSEQVLSISENPLVVIGRHGQGRTVAFMGFTPEYAERRSPWDAKIVSTQLLDQEFVSQPGTRAYFALFMRMIAAATGERPVTSYADILAARSEPLFEVLQDQPPATLQLPKAVQAAVSGGKANGSFRLPNGPRYARLVRVRAEWDAPETQAPYLVIYSDNYFDLMPAEAKELSLEFRLPAATNKPVHGRLIVEGSNVAAAEIPITLKPQ